jgi:uncharacterized membrane protein YvbJ
MALINCPDCGKEMADFAICPHCGSGKVLLNSKEYKKIRSAPKNALIGCVGAILFCILIFFLSFWH